MMQSLVKFIMRALGLLPLRVHYFLSRILAFLAGKVFRYRVKIVEQNLAAAFPDKDTKELKHIRNRFYLHLGDVLAETIWFGASRGPARLRRSHLVEISNVEVLNGLYENAPGVMVLMSHAGNWELIGGIGSYNYSDQPSCFTEQNFCVVYLRQNPMWDDIMRSNRTASLIDSEGFPGYLESREVVRYVFEHRDEKKIYNFITDQHPYFKSRDFLVVNFMHRDCDSMRGAASLAHKFGLAVCYMGMPCESRGHYRIEYTTITEDASSMDADDIMRKFYKLLEADIEAQPWNYLWTHNRWKRFPK